MPLSPCCEGNAHGQFQTPAQNETGKTYCRVCLLSAYGDYRRRGSVWQSWIDTGDADWATSPAGVVALSPASDGQSCLVSGISGTTGNATVTPSCTPVDADGNLQTPISGTPIQVQVSQPPSGPATQIVETIGPVTEQS
jgi:hypothetical protein